MLIILLTSNSGMVSAQLYTIRDCPTGFDITTEFICNKNLNSTELPEIPRDLQAKNLTLKLTVNYHSLAQLPAHLYPGSKFNSLNFEQNRIEIIANNSFDRITFLYELTLNKNLIKNIDFAFRNTSQNCADGFKSMHHLRLYENQIMWLKNNTFDCLISLTIITLYDNLLSFIEVDAFKGLNTLREVYLYNNKLVTLEPLIFQPVMSLIKLTASSNQITSLDSQLFQSGRKIQSLYLTVNKISHIDRDCFCHLTDLKTIWLDFNRLTDINFFTCPNTLTNLALSTNQITFSKTKSPFENLTSLLTLDLASNGLGDSIDDFTFKGLSRLTTLGLIRNNITRFTHNSFTHMRLLYLIDLKENCIVTLDSSVFRRNFRLSKLFLEYNRIVRLSPHMFTYLRYLDELHLTGNQITTIENGTFTSLSYLNYLYLSGNKLAFLSDSTLKGLSNLIELDLSNNQIEFITRDTFKELKLLANINIKYNRLTYVDVVFPASTAILNLQFNSIVYVEARSFDVARKISGLELQHNKLRILQRHLMYNFDQAIQQISFFNNSIAIVERGVFIISKRSFNYVDLKLNKIKIIISNNFNGLNTVKIDLSHNEIEVLEDYAFNSTFLWNGKNSLKHLYIDSNQIKEMATKAFYGLTQLEELTLYNNSLTRIKTDQFNSLLSILFLDLSSNKIEVIEENAFQNINISTLVLGDNPIKSIHKDFTRDLSSFTFIKFSKRTLLDLGLDGVVGAFQPRRVAKRNIYTFYKAIFFIVVDERGLYDEEFCAMSIQLLERNILMNMVELSDINRILQECSDLKAFQLDPEKKYLF